MFSLRTDRTRRPRALRVDFITPVEADAEAEAVVPVVWPLLVAVAVEAKPTASTPAPAEAGPVLVLVPVLVILLLVLVGVAVGTSSRAVISPAFLPRVSAIIELTTGVAAVLAGVEVVGPEEGPSPSMCSCSDGCENRLTVYMREAVLLFPPHSTPPPWS